MGIPVPDLAADAGAVALSEVKARDGVRWWLEGRPDEKGRQVLVRRDADGTVTRLSPEGFNVRSRVHEYGGAAYLVEDGLVIVSDFSTGRLNRVVAPGELEPFTPERAWRYADMILDRAHGRLIAIREDHETSTLERHGEAENAIVAIDLASGEVSVLVDGADFYAAPRLSPDGSQLAWLEWRHPNMPWDGTTLRLAPVAGDGSIGEAETVAGSQSDWISPAALVARRRPPFRRGAGRLDEPVPVRRRPGRGGHGPRGGVRLPRLAVRLLDLRVRGRRVDRGGWPGRVVGIGCTASGRSPAPSARSRCRSPR